MLDQDISRLRQQLASLERSAQIHTLHLESKKAEKIRGRIPAVEKTLDALLRLKEMQEKYGI